MKNKLADLNNHLFCQLERLGDEELSAEQLDTESKRADAIIGVAEQVVKNAALQLQAASLLAQHGYRIDGHLQGIAPDAPRLTIEDRT